MKITRKGFTGLEVVLVVAVVGALIGLFAPKTIASVGNLWNGGTKNQSKQIHKIDEKYTIGRLDERGKFIKLGDYSKKEDLQNLVAQEAPEKWSTKVKIITGLLIVLFVAFPSLAIKAWLKAKSNIFQIVTGIEKARTKLPPDAVATLEASLSSKMDQSAKDAVVVIKERLPAENIK